MARLIVLLTLLAGGANVTAQTPAVRDNAGATLGFYAGFDVPNQSVGSQIGRVKVISSTGYVATFIASTGRLAVNGTQTLDGGLISNPVVFQALDCSGQGYVFTNSSASFQIDGQVPIPGAVILASGSPGLYDVWYVPKLATPLVAGAQAPLFVRGLINGQCLPAGGVSADTVLFPALPNVPGVTGFPSVPFVPPLRIDVVPVSAVFSIFRDSFESTQAAMPRLQAAYVA